MRVVVIGEGGSIWGRDWGKSCQKWDGCFICGKILIQSLIQWTTAQVNNYLLASAWRRRDWLEFEAWDHKATGAVLKHRPYFDSYLIQLMYHSFRFLPDLTPGGEGDSMGGTRFFFPLRMIVCSLVFLHGRSSSPLLEGG